MRNQQLPGCSMNIFYKNMYLMFLKNKMNSEFKLLMENKDTFMA